MKVRIKDYQAIKEAEFDFSKGIIVIVGQTNSGKSSVIRAIEGAINNRQGNSFVNYNADKTVVEIEEGDNKIIWTKARKGESSYNINGTHLLKIGKNQLDEVGDLLNMSEIEVSGEKFRLNFWKQMTPPFLLNKTSGQLFDFISKSREQELVVQYQQDKLSDIKQIDKDITAINTTIDSKKSDEAKYIETLKLLKPAYDFNFDLLKQANDFYNSLNTMIEVYTEQDKKSLDNFKVYNESKEFLEKVSSKFDSISLQKTKLDGVSSLIEAYNSSDTYFTQAKSTFDDYNSSFKELSSKVESLEKVYNSAHELDNKISTLKNLITTYENSLSNYGISKSNLDSIILEEKKINEELSTIDVCPYCGSSLKNHNHEV